MAQDPATAASLREDARFVLAGREKQGLIIDEAQAVGSVLAAARGLIDEQRSRNGRFVILGSAQPVLVRGVGQSLAGRAAVVELSPLTAGEAGTGESAVDWRTVWLKGGFPDALRGDFREWWEAYLRLFLERDLPQYGVPADAVFMRRLLTMLAHSQGGLLNASQLGASLGVSYHTIQRYLTVLEQTFLIRPLRPYFRNLGKGVGSSTRRQGSIAFPAASRGQASASLSTARREPVRSPRAAAFRAFPTYPPQSVT